jgi:hypothetical protein
VGGRAPSVHDPLRDPLMIKVGDLLPQMKVFQQRRPPLAGLERMVSIGEP